MTGNDQSRVSQRLNICIHAYLFTQRADEGWKASGHRHAELEKATRDNHSLQFYLDLLPCESTIFRHPWYGPEWWSPTNLPSMQVHGVGHICFKNSKQANTTIQWTRFWAILRSNAIVVTIVVTQCQTASLSVCSLVTGEQRCTCERVSQNLKVTRFSYISSTQKTRVWSHGIW